MTSTSRTATLMVLLAASLAATSATAVTYIPAQNDGFKKTEEFVCETPRHHIVIDGLDRTGYRYRAWSKPKTASARPDVELRNGSDDLQGTGSCMATQYTFHSGNVTYLISDNVGCTADYPPANAIGRVDVIGKWEKQGRPLVHQVT